jgi:hypothetical protein
MASWPTFRGFPFAANLTWAQLEAAISTNSFIYSTVTLSPLLVPSAGQNKCAKAEMPKVQVNRDEAVRNQNPDVVQRQDFDLVTSPKGGLGLSYCF